MMRDRPSSKNKMIPVVVGRWLIDNRTRDTSQELHEGPTRTAFIDGFADTDYN